MSHRSSRTRWNLGRGFVLRCPTLPFDRFAGSVPPSIEGRRAYIRECLANPLVVEALRLASPSLCTELDAWREAPDTPRGRSTERSLLRYLGRMSGRGTPFGLFSGVATGTWGSHSELSLPGSQAWRRRTSLDGRALEMLCYELEGDPEVRRSLPTRVSSSLYRHHERLRYARRDARGDYVLVDLEPTPYLLATLERARGGATEDELVAGLQFDVDGVDEAQAREYVDELRRAGVLESALHPSVTGPEPLRALTDALADVSAPAAGDVRAVAEQLRDLDARAPGLASSDTRAIAERARGLAAGIDPARALRADLVLGSCGQLGPDVRARLVEAVQLIERLDAGEVDETLERFRDAFVERYGEAEVPLMTALDEDGGIGFERGERVDPQTVPLLASLRFPGSIGMPSMPVQPRDQHLMRLYEDAIRGGQTEVVLEDADVEALTVVRRTPLPDALCTLATLRASSAEALARGEFRVLVEWVDGPSGAKLLGRFCHASSEVRELVQEHVRAEEALRPEAIFAEVAHQESGRAGNVASRPVLRDHEIEFGGVSGAPSSGRITVDDLVLSVVDGRLELRSRSLDRPVVPRVTCAHNFHDRGLSAYRFLCALQNQDGRGGGFGWGALRNAPFLPRVRRGHVVLARARWLLVEDELRPLAEATAGEKRARTPEAIAALRQRGAQAVAELRERRGLPRWVVLVDGDNELPVDLEDELAVDSFVHLVRRRSQVILRELFAGPDELVVRGPSGRHAHQLLCTFVRQGAPRPSTRPRPSAAMREAAAAARRSFAPGGPWLYLKLYCGPGVADAVLRDAVAPLVHHARTQGWCDRWFFLRYRDPEPHLRVRLHGSPEHLWGRVLPAAHAMLGPLAEAGRLASIQVDTYVQEIERYGGPEGIVLAERLFEADSDAALRLLDALAPGADGVDARWRVALMSAEHLLRDLSGSRAERREVIETLASSFAEEHRADSVLRKQLGQRFRAERAALLDSLADELDPMHPLGPAWEILRERGEALARIAPQGVAPAVAASIVHMTCNRLLASHQRAQEMVIYDLLRRSHATLAALRRPDPVPAAAE